MHYYQIRLVLNRDRIDLISLLAQTTSQSRGVLAGPFQPYRRRMLLSEPAMRYFRIRCYVGGDSFL